MADGAESDGPKADETAERQAAPASRFAATYPRDADLDALVAAFDAGDFRRVREAVPRIVASAKDDAVKRAAGDLLARTKADPLATLLVVISALLLVLLTAWWVTHNGKP